MRAKRLLRLTAAGVLAWLALAGCGERIERADQPVDTAVVMSQRLLDSLRDSLSIQAVELPPALDDSIVLGSPTTVTRTDSIIGDSLYRAGGRCTTCHGESGQGLASLGPDLTDDVWLHGDGSLPFLQRIILTGALPRRMPIVMPAFATRLSAEEAYRIAAYVFTLSHPNAVVDSAAARDSSAAMVDSATVPIDTI